MPEGVKCPGVADEEVARGGRPVRGTTAGVAVDGLGAGIAVVHGPLPLALAVPDEDDLALAVDVFDLQVGQLADVCTCVVQQAHDGVFAAREVHAAGRGDTAPSAGPR